MRSLSVIGAAVLLFFQVARCNANTSPTFERDTLLLNDDVANVVARGQASSEDDIFRRSALLPGKTVLKESSRHNRSTSDSDALDGRAVLAKWLDPLGLEKRACTSAGYTASCGGKFRRIQTSLLVK